MINHKIRNICCLENSSELTLKKSKNDTCLTLGPYLLSSCLKKKKFVSAASKRSGFFFAIITSLSRSSRLSRPRQNALVILSGQFGLPLDWTESISRETLKLKMYKSTVNYHYWKVKTHNILPLMETEKGHGFLVQLEITEAKQYKQKPYLE